MSRLSFIIPVFNAVTYLQDCVDSVMAWPWPDKEVILIDDGSTDGSAALCDALADRYTPDIVHVLHRRHSGVSAARNAGLDMASGEWVWMVDADDVLLSEGQVASMLPSFEALSEVRFVVTGFVWVEDGVSRSYGASPVEVPYNLWRCWFHRRTIERNKLRFTLGRRYAEDQEFIFRYLVSLGRRDGRVMAIDKPLYRYTMRPGSTMNRQGVRWLQVRDMAMVWVQMVLTALWRGWCDNRWMWREVRRVAKALLVTLLRR